jgi:CheY-like chemotaxis protein
MGGSIDLQSVFNKGTTVEYSLTLPVAGHVPGTFGRPELSFARHTRDVLVVEDNATNRLVARAMLERLGCTVWTAEDGSRALEEVKRHDFDVIFMDIQMPGLDGFESTRQIRYLQKGRQVPIIALTANAYEDDRLRSEEAGMNEHIAKPCTMLRLAEALDQWAPARQVREDPSPTSRV